MERILRIFNREYGNVNQAALLLGFFAFLSQILGLLRDRSFAHFLGPSASLDIYYAAFRVPDFIFLSIASLASITVLIPFLLSRMPDGVASENAQKFINDVFSVFLGTLIFVSVLAFVFMPHLIPLVAPGFDLSSQSQVIVLSRIMLLSPILLGLSNLFGSITQLFRKFFLYALSPIFYNLGIILGVLVLYPIFGLKGLALGVVLGAFLHLMIQVLSSRGSGFHMNFSRNINFTDIKQVVMISLPRTLGLSFNNLALIVIVSIASVLRTGSISIYNLSLNLQNVPLGIIGLSYAVAAFPTLTKSYASGAMDEFKDHLRSAARQIIFWSLPVTFLFIVLRAQIVRVILGSGVFSWEHTRLVAASLALFAVSMMAQGLIALFARAYYARGNTKRPLSINLFCSVSIIILAYVLLYAFKHYPIFSYFIESALKVEDLPGTEVLMLPLAYSLGTVLNFCLLWLSIKRDFMYSEKFISATFFQSLVSSFTIGVVSYLGLNVLSPLFSNATFWGVFAQGFFAGILGIFAGVLVLYMLRNREFMDLVELFKTKFWQDKTVAPPQEVL